MASLGAASIRAACEYPVGNPGDCFREAKVVGMEKKGWAGRGRIVRTWGLTGCAGCRLSGIIPGFCEGGVGAESGRSGKRRCFRGQHQNEMSRGYPGEVLRRQLVTRN